MQPYLNQLYQAIDEDTYATYQLACEQSSRASSILKFDVIPEEVQTSLPEHCVPVLPTTEYNTQRVQYAQHHCPWPTSGITHNHTDFEAHISALPRWKQQILMHWESVEKDILLSYLRGEPLITMASDGGFNQETGKGSFGAVIADATTNVASIGGTAPGRPDIHCSFRSEHYGLLAACSFLNELLAFYKIRGNYVSDNQHRSRRILVWLDSKSVIARINKHRKYEPQLGEMMDADMDLELQTLHEISQLEKKGFTFLPLQHVKAHQDDIKPYSELAREAQLNIDADRIATVFAHSNYIQQKYYPPSCVSASLYIDSVAITARYKECLRHAMHFPALKKYMTVKWDWTDRTVDQIWWQVHGQALKRLSHADRQKIQKFNFYHLPTNRRLNKFQPTTEPTCHDCNNIEETDDHIIWCISADRVMAKQRWEDDIFHYLSDLHTPASPSA